MIAATLRKTAASVHRFIAVTGVNIARAALDRIAFNTDAPDWRDVEAADSLDAAHDLLARNVPRGAP